MPLSQACREVGVVDHQTHHERVLGQDVLLVERPQRTLYCPRFGWTAEGEEEDLSGLKTGSVPETGASRWVEEGGVLVGEEEQTGGC